MTEEARFFNGANLVVSGDSKVRLSLWR